MGVISGGANRFDLRPVRHSQDYMGNHKAHFMAMNICNPKPGYHYYYQTTGRGGGNILRYQQLGYEMVKSTDQERWGAELPPEIAREVDTVKAFGDVVLMRIPVEKYREIRKRKARDARIAREGAEDSYLGKGEQISAAMGQYAPAAGVYFRRANHSTGARDFRGSDGE